MHFSRLERKNLEQGVILNIQVLISTFESVALLLGIGAMGIWISGKRVLPKDALGVLSILALDIALPSLIFVNILQNFRPSEFQGWWLLPVWWLGFTVFQACLTAFFSLFSRVENRREFAVSLFFQNALFFPLAIMTGLFGQDSPYIVDLFFFTMFFPSLLFGAAHIFFGKSAALDWSKIINKVLLATVTATIIRLVGAEPFIPEFIISGLSMVGGMALPLLLLILGGNLYIDYKEKGARYPLEAGKFVLVKNFLFPLAALAALLIIRPEYNLALLIILQSAVPPVTAVPILTERAGGNRQIVNQFMLASFLVSLISIPFVIGLFGMYFQPPGP